MDKTIAPPISDNVEEILRKVNALNMRKHTMEKIIEGVSSPDGFVLSMKGGPLRSDDLPAHVVASINTILYEFAEHSHKEVIQEFSELLSNQKEG